MQYLSGITQRPAADRLYTQLYIMYMLTTATNKYIMYYYV